MCGIAGIISHSNTICVKQWLHQASRILQHRGNDDDGFVLFNDTQQYCSKFEHQFCPHSSLPYLQYTPLENIPDTAYKIGLLHRRLSIIDLSEYGHQPMCDELGNVWITYNGEIYNYIELRKNFIQKGIRFFSNTDTEVVLKAYLYYGKNFVHYLNGMWALAIFDKRTNELILSRDRIGVKPLYYYQSKNIFAFASEQKTFIQSKLIPFEIEYSALSKYLIDNVLEDTEDGLIKNIKEILPGEILSVSITQLSLKKEKYFEINNLLQQPLYADEKYIISHTRELINQSVSQHLRSDVDVAISLSGGIDSSIIAISSAQSGVKNIHSFSVVYPNYEKMDESQYVYSIQKKINITGHFIQPDVYHFFKDIDELLYSQDIPIWSTSTYNQFLLMKEVKKQGIKVILSGQGSDELFAGYIHHYIAYWLSLIQQRKWRAAHQHMSSSKPYIPSVYLTFIKSLIKNFYLPQKHIATRYLSKDILHPHTEHFSHRISNSMRIELLRDLSYRRLKAFLKCEDRCSMWHSVESRLPFSDDLSLLQWAFQIPDEIKLKNGISKYVLREAFKESLPQDIYQRKDKKAFDAPLKEWMQEYEKDVLDEIKNGWKEIVNLNNIQRIQSFNDLTAAEAHLVFKLFILNRWKKLWIK